MARRMLVFGGKSFIPRLGDLLLNQTVNVLLVMYLGAAALALYARPRSLVRHVQTLVERFAFVLTPTASSLHVMRRKEELQRLMIKATAYAAYIALPLVLTLMILGGPILRCWMGAHYERGLVLAILALGYLPRLIQRPVVTILAGMNAHGLPGLANFIAGVLSVVLAIVGLSYFGCGLVGVAVAVVSPLVLANGFCVPLYACRRLEMPMGQYVKSALGGPLLCGAVFGLTLAITRISFLEHPVLSLLGGMLLGGPVLGALYWYHAVPAPFRRKVLERVRVVCHSFYIRGTLRF